MDVISVNERFVVELKAVLKYAEWSFDNFCLLNRDMALDDTMYAHSDYVGVAKDYNYIDEEGNIREFHEETADDDRQSEGEAADDDRQSEEEADNDLNNNDNNSEGNAPFDVNISDEESTDDNENVIDSPLLKELIMKTLLLITEMISKGMLWDELKKQNQPERFLKEHSDSGILMIIFRNGMV